MTDQGDMFGGDLEHLRIETRRKSIPPNGTTCPVCDQKVDRTRRRLSQPMARILIAMYRQDQRAPGQWIHLVDLLARDFPKRAPGDGQKLRHWGLIEKDADAQPENGAKSAGQYRITALGIRFVLRQVQMHSHGFSFNNQFAIDTKADLVGIEWCLGKGFNYQELMRETGAYPP